MASVSYTDAFLICGNIFADWPVELLDFCWSHFPILENFFLAGLTLFISFFSQQRSPLLHPYCTKRRLGRSLLYKVFGKYSSGPLYGNHKTRRCKLVFSKEGRYAAKDR